MVKGIRRGQNSFGRAVEQGSVADNDVVSLRYPAGWFTAVYNGGMLLQEGDVPEEYTFPGIGERRCMKPIFTSWRLEEHAEAALPQELTQPRRYPT